MATIPLMYQAPQVTTPDWGRTMLTMAQLREMQDQGAIRAFQLGQAQREQGQLDQFMQQWGQASRAPGGAPLPPSGGMTPGSSPMLPARQVMTGANSPDVGGMEAGGLPYASVATPTQFPGVARPPGPPPGDIQGPPAPGGPQAPMPPQVPAGGPQAQASPVTTPALPTSGSNHMDDVESRVKLYQWAMANTPLVAPKIIKPMIEADTAIMNAQNQQFDRQMKQLGTMQQWLSAVQDTPEASKPLVYDQARQFALAAKLPGAETLPPVWNEAAAGRVEAASRLLQTQQERIKQQQDQFKLVTDRYDALTKGREADIKAGELGVKKTQAQIDQAKLLEVTTHDTMGGGLATVPKYPGAAAAMGLPGAQGGMATSLTDAQGNPMRGKAAMEAEGKLRDDFTKDSKEYRTVVDNYGTLNRATQNPSQAGDIALVFAYMKILDPTSVVREGEQATVQNAGTIPERIYGLYNRMLGGTGRMDDKVRQDFIDQAHGIYQSRTEQHFKLRDQYQTLANSYQLNPANVTMDYTATGQKTQGQGPGRQSSATQGQVLTPAQWQQTLAANQALATPRSEAFLRAELLKQGWRVP